MTTEQNMFKQFAEFLRSNRDSCFKTIRTNVVRKRVGYSDYTCWDETVSFDELEVVDFDSLIKQIDQFSQSFNKDKQ
jgi:hypothetical protein